MNKRETPIELCGADEVVPSVILCKRVPGGRIALTRLPAGEVVAFDAQCPHLNGPLWAGRIRGTEVICPWHGFRFDLRSGKPPEMDSIMRLTHYAVEIRDGRIFVDTSATQE
jgi:nitrite reductase/ring-hydroxylating ferredoxin subunit